MQVSEQVKAIAKTVHPDLKVEVNPTNGENVASMFDTEGALQTHVIDHEHLVKKAWKDLGADLHSFVSKIGHKPHAEIQ